MATGNGWLAAVDSTPNLLSCSRDPTVFQGSVHPIDSTRYVRVGVNTVASQLWNAVADKSYYAPAYRRARADANMKRIKTLMIRRSSFLGSPPLNRRQNYRIKFFKLFPSVPRQESKRVQTFKAWYENGKQGQKFATPGLSPKHLLHPVTVQFRGRRSDSCSPRTGR